MNKTRSSKKKLSPEEVENLLKTLQQRFEEHLERHKSFNWADVQAKLEKAPEKLWSLQQMEETGGEPDVVALDKKSGEFLFFDCSPESPKGRRSLCYDAEALKARKENKPKNSALEMAAEMGIELLSAEQYKELQQLGEFDLKTSSWLLTPAAIRELDGAIFGDRRYDHVFIYHNGAQSYYAARGFRGVLRV